MSDAPEPSAEGTDNMRAEYDFSGAVRGATARRYADGANVVVDPIPQPICFVIQPFDRGKFDKRFVDAFQPALSQAGFAVYRVDQDPGTDVMIAVIERGIREAEICLADITNDNPNVWYELGFAYAARKPVILTSSSIRLETR